MKMFISSVFFTLAIASLAQEDPYAKEILDRVAQKANAYSTISLDYSFTVEDKKTNDKKTEEGQIIIKGKKYKINIGVSEIFCDGKAIYTYLKSVQEVNIVAYDEQASSADMTNPRNLFTMYTKEYKYEYIGEEAMDGRIFHKIDLYPRNLKSSYARLRLFVDKNKDELYCVQIQAKNGNYYTFKILDVKTNISVPDTEFTFNSADYPGVEVVDLR